VKEAGADETPKKICPACGKPMAGSRRSGSLTAFLLGASNCACSPGRSFSEIAGPYALAGQAADDRDLCPKCGLQVVPGSREGAQGGSARQSIDCKCPPDQAFEGGAMSAKFSKLKESGTGTIFMSNAGVSNPGAAVTIDLAPGAIIGGAYRIIQLIGRGGMGEVYLARHETLDKKCALKVIPPEQVTENGWQRFQMEARGRGQVGAHQSGASH
jgi:ribosomal protein S27AE